MWRLRDGCIASQRLAASTSQWLATLQHQCCAFALSPVAWALAKRRLDWLLNAVSCNHTLLLLVVQTLDKNSNTSSSSGCVTCSTTKLCGSARLHIMSLGQIAFGGASDPQATYQQLFALVKPSLH